MTDLRHRINRSILVDFGHSLGKIWGFYCSAILTSAVGFFSVPLLIDALDIHVWSQLVAAQSTSLVIALFITGGWGLTGPTLIAKTNQVDREAIYWQSYGQRVQLLLLAMPVLLVYSVCSFRSQTLEFFLISLSSVLPALTAAWYYIGQGSPSSLFWYDALPRAGITIATTLLAFSFKNLTVMAWSLALLNVMLALVPFLTIANATPTLRNFKWFHFQNLKHLNHSLLASIASSLYLYAPITIASWVASSTLPVFAMADKILKFEAGSLVPFVQFAQGKFRISAERVSRRRALTVILIFSTGATLIAPVACLAEPVLVQILGNDSVTVPVTLAALMSATLGFTLVEQAVGAVCLLSFGRTKHLAAAMVTGAVLCVSISVTAGQVYGPIGFGASLLISEILVVALMLVSMFRILGEDSGSQDDALADSRNHLEARASANGTTKFFNDNSHRSDRISNDA